MLSPREEGGMCHPHKLGAIVIEESLDKALQDTDFSGLPVASTYEDPVGVKNSLALSLKQHPFLAPFVCRETPYSLH